MLLPALFKFFELLNNALRYPVIFPANSTAVLASGCVY